MALTNDSIITIVNTIRNKDLQGEDFTAAEWQTLINANSQKLFAMKLGLPTRYQVNAPVEQKGAGVSRKLSEELRPFFVRENVPVVGGSADFSAKNIGYMLAIDPSSITGRGFDELEPDEVADRLGSSVVSPTAADPVYMWSGENTILVYPSTLTPITISYYTFPTDAVVVFTTNAITLQPEYSAGASTETGWEDKELIEIAYMCLRDLGINTERQDVAAYAQNIINNE